ncbi:MAG: ABC transporter ATP-binding protein [Proteobacteria bacterium]|nr:ABC transporter ATP-binding protein [Pseudomonadota bacterium]MCP4919886.1 ABC transporter ATP-binding protein [Pseudomonadota bacterium]
MILSVTDLHVELGGTPIVRGVDVSVDAGEVVALLGPSGCGKTTTLRAIAGLETASAGRIELSNRDLVGVPAHERGLGLVFQEGALFPHLTVRGNIGFATKEARRVDELLALLRLKGLGDRPVHALSGGQRQRVALGRALAPRPALLLMDEPFGSLDTALRIELRSEFFALARETGVAVLLVTHDQDEAASCADRIALMQEGRIAQLGSPEDLRRRPASRFVVQFMGAAALLPGPDGDIVTCPEDLRFDPEGSISGIVEALETAGGMPVAHVRIDDVLVRVIAIGAPPVGETATLTRVGSGHAVLSR